jgi:hypothetical protein
VVCWEFHVIFSNFLSVLAILRVGVRLEGWCVGRARTLKKGGAKKGRGSGVLFLKLLLITSTCWHFYRGLDQPLINSVMSMFSKIPNNDASFWNVFIYLFTHIHCQYMWDRLEAVPSYAVVARGHIRQHPSSANSLLNWVNCCFLTSFTKQETAAFEFPKTSFIGTWSNWV